MIKSLVDFGRSFVFTDIIFRRVLSNSGWLLSANTVSMGLGFLQGVIVARLLGVEQFGVLTLIVSYTTIVNQLVDSRVWETVIKFVVKFREANKFIKATATIKLCYYVDVVTGILAFLIVFLTAHLAARLFIKDVSITGFVQLYALMILVSIPFDTSSALLRVADRFNWLAYLETGTMMLRLIGVIVILLFGGGIKSLLILYLFIKLMQTFSIIVLALKLSPELNLVSWGRAPLSSLRGEYKALIYFLAATNGNAFLKLLRDIDLLAISFWLTPTHVGLYRVARSMISLMQFPIAPLYATSYPEFARLWHQEKFQSLRQLVSKLTVSSTVVAIVSFIIIWIAGPTIIALIVGEEYLPAVPVLRWLAFGAAIAIATNFGHPLLIAVDRVSISAMAIALGVVVQLTLLVMLLPTIGIVGAGISFVSFYIIWAAIIIGTGSRIWQKSLSGSVP